MPLFLDVLRSETAQSPDRQASALAGLRAYQQAERPPARPRRPVIASAGRATLRDHGGTGRPVVVVPSLINPPDVLDLSPETSLLAWLAEQGCRPLLVDWGVPSRDDAADVAGHVADMLLPLLAKCEGPPILVGYCLGGTMTLAAACLAPVAGLALIAAPWRFSGYGDAARADIAALWAQAEPSCRALRLVPVEVLQAGFWRLDPARTVAKFEHFGALDPDSDAARAFVRLEDWANSGAPLTYPAGRQLFEELLAADRPGRGEWKVAGRTVGPALIDCPSIEFVSTTDRITPAATAAGLGERHETAAGHVGMVVGRGARAALWQPLADWITRVPRAR